jgi:MFS family permease
MTSSNTLESGPSLLPYYLIVFGMAAGLASVVTLLAEFRNTLGFSEFSIGASVAGGLGAGFIAALTLGPQADRGRAPLMLRSGLLLGLAGLIVMAVATDFWLFMLGRVLMGLAFGVAQPATRRTVIVADPQNLGRNVGRLGAFDVAGFVVGPAAAAALNAIGGFRAPFWFMAVFLALLIPTAWRAQSDTAAKDVTRQPLSDLLKNRQLLGACSVVSAYFVFIGAFESVWILDMDNRGASQWQIGVTVTCIALPIAVLAPWGGGLAQRYGPRKWALAMITTCSIFNALFGLVPGLVALILLTIGCGFAEGIGFPSGTMLVSSSVPQSRQAAAQGLASAIEVGTAAIAALGLAAVYASAGHTAAYLTASATMLVLLTVGWKLTAGIGGPQEKVSQSSTE